MLKLKLLQDSVGQTISSTNPFTLTTVAVCIQSMPSFIPATSNLWKMQCWYSSFYVYWLLCWSFIEDPVTGTTYFSTHDFCSCFEFLKCRYRAMARHGLIIKTNSIV